MMDLGAIKKRVANNYPGAIINPLTGEPYRDTNGNVLTRKKQRYGEILINNVKGVFFKFPNDTYLNNLPVYAIQIYSQAKSYIGTGGINPAGTPTTIPPGMVGIPQGRDSGFPTISYDDLNNIWLKIKDDQVNALVDGLQGAEMIRSLNNGLIYKFENALEKIQWTQSGMDVTNGYQFSGQGAAGVFTELCIPYRIYYYGV